MEIVGIVLLIVIISDSKSPATLVGFMLVTSESALLLISFFTLAVKISDETK